MPDRCTWFRDARWGIMCHYLAGLPGSGNDAFDIPADVWQAQCDACDVDGLAAQVASTGAGYLLFTVGQNSGHYCAPNPVYDELVGLTPSRCARRDVIADLAAALQSYGVKLMVYATSGAPFWPPAAAALRWTNNHQVPGERLAEFQRKWNRVLAYWSTTWGDAVAGWWLDGCYFGRDMYEFDDEPNWGSLTAALRAGNPDAIVAYNPGVKVPVITQGGEDYTAGELAGALHVGHYAPGGFALPLAKVGEAQYHALTFLGQYWRVGPPRFPDALAIGYTQFVIGFGGVLTWDVPIGQDGLIPGDCLRQLRVIGAAV